MKKLECYLRTHRRRWALTQQELATLVGLQSGPAISRLESRQRQPSLEFAFACEILLGISPPELFPGLFAEVEDAVMRRAYQLHEQLQGGSSRTAQAKIDILMDALARAANRAHQKAHE